MDKIDRKRLLELFASLRAGKFTFTDSAGRMKKDSGPGWKCAWVEIFFSDGRWRKCSLDDFRDEDVVRLMRAEDWKKIGFDPETMEPLN